MVLGITLIGITSQVLPAYLIGIALHVVLPK